MPPHRRQPGGPLGRLDTHGEIRWMLERFKGSCSCDRRTIMRAARRSQSSRTQMLRKLIGGLGSPCDWSRIGSAPCALYSGAPMYFVSPLSGTWFWTSTPLWIAVRYAGVFTDPSALNVGAAQITSYACHSPGGRMAFASGMYCL